MIYNFCGNYFLLEVISFILFIKNVFIKIKNPIFPPKNTRYTIDAKKQNYLF